MKRRYGLILSVLIVALLVGGCGLWVWQAKQQYALDRQLIAALEKGNMKQALDLVNAGADPNTRYRSQSVPTLKGLLNQLLHKSNVPADYSPTALMMACGGIWADVHEQNKWEQSKWIDAIDLQLVQAMLLHGANINSKNYLYGCTTVLHRAVLDKNKVLISQLLAYGADPTIPDDAGNTPIEFARLYYPNIVTLLRKHAN